MGSYDRRLFMQMADAVERLAGARSLPELEVAAGAELGVLGCELTVGALVRKEPCGEQAVDIIFGEQSHPWVAHYEASGLGAVCPISGSAGPSPLCWREIRARRLTAAQQAVFDQLGDFALLEGHIVHVTGFGSISAVVSSAGRRIAVEDPEVRTRLHLLSVNYGLLALALWSTEHELPSAAPPPLTRRQLDCLQWALEGRTSSEIAERLGLSHRTVEEHFQKACATLGVRTRVQACAVAARRGLVSP